MICKKVVNLSENLFKKNYIENEIILIIKER